MKCDALESWIRCLCAAAATAIVAACTAPRPTGVQPDQQGRLEAILPNVGNGLCVLVKCPNGNAVLNDCGSLLGEGSGDLQSAVALIKGQIGSLARNAKLYVLTAAVRSSWPSQYRS